MFKKWCVMKFFFFLSVLLVTNLFAEVQDHFKKVVGKESFSQFQVKNIDFIYMINLDQRPEKFASCTEQLNPYGIHPFRFSAVNGWELSLKTLNAVGVKYESWMQNDHWGTCYLPEDGGQPYHEIVHIVGRNYFCHTMGRGTIGIVLSHLSVLQDAYDSGYETVWIMEDDIQVIRNPHLLSHYIEELDSLIGKRKWDVLFTDRDTKNSEGKYIPCLSYAWKPNFAPSRPEKFAKRKSVGSDFMKIGARYGAYSMIVRRTGMKKILDFIKKYRIFLPYDMEYYLPPGIQMYSILDDVISTQPKALSDNGSPGYLNKKSFVTP